jgi:hypothetical protein
MNPTRIIELIKLANKISGREKYAVNIDDFGCYIYEYVNGFKKLMTVCLEESESISYIQEIINEEEGKQNVIINK